jgi:hypothetical protein
VLLGPAPRAERPAEDDTDSPTAGGRLMWDSSDDLDLIGDLWAHIPFALDDRNRLFFGLDTRTTVERTTGELTFLVRDLQYEIDVGWRRSMRWLGGGTLSAFLGQRGKEAVDRDGQPFLTYVGVGLESSGFRRVEQRPFCRSDDCDHRNERVEWAVSGGPVIREREVQGDVVLRGAARFWPGPRRSKLLSMLRLEVKLDGYLDGGTLRADVALGPSLELPVAGGRRFALFAHYQESDNPLGLGHSGVLAGIDYSEGAGSRPVGPGAPDVEGIVGAGAGGDSRRSGQLQLRFTSPVFARQWYAVFDIDANVLTAEDTGDLYYLYFAGFERTVGDLLTGLFFYHRSNHQLAEPNDTVTSLNVIEAGVETRDWHRVARSDGSARWGAIDGRLRLGYLLDSTFGEDRRWHLRGGVRWTAPVPGRIRPFVRFDAEAGDVERQAFALGIAVPPSWEFRAEYREDEQYFSRDDTALLLVARYGF